MQPPLLYGEARRLLQPAAPPRLAHALSRTLLVLGVVSMPLTAAWAQAVSPAEAANQELLRQQERERILRQQQEPAPDVRLERPQAPADLGRLPIDESPCFKIERILLGGDAAEKFQWALAAANRAEAGTDDAAIGRCLGSRGINLVMKRVQNAIVSRGYVTTRVLAEPQDLNAGTLGLTLIPGRIRGIRFAAGTDARATQWNAVPVRPGDPLNLRDIEQALENFKRVPTAEADIQITPAEGLDARPGDSDLVISWKQGFPFRLSVSADDSGTKATGKYQGAVILSYDNLWSLNDLLYFSFNHDLGGGDPGRRGTRGYTAHYSLPFGYWLLGFTASSNRYYQSVAGANQTYLYSGESRNGDIRLSRLIYRDAVRKNHAVAARMDALIEEFHRRYRSGSAAPSHGGLGRWPCASRIHRRKHARPEPRLPPWHRRDERLARTRRSLWRGHVPPRNRHRGRVLEHADCRWRATLAL